MVSNTLGMELDELIQTLKRVGKKSGKDPDYVKLRKQLPKDWPF